MVSLVDALREQGHGLNLGRVKKPCPSGPCAYVKELPGGR